ncbi:MAG: TetR/AcrR family transcriptional regulator [Verrucomicrobiota bacterium]
MRLKSEDFVDQASELLKEQCGGDVALSMILQACNAKKGSLYHFFPGGKDQLLTAAVEKMGRCALANVQECIGRTDTAAQAIEMHLLHIAKLSDKPEGFVGLPFLTVAATIGTSSSTINDACFNAIAAIKSVLVKQLVADGFSRKRSNDLAEFSAFAVDGAILASRSRGNTKPLRLAAANLVLLYTR